MPNWIIRRCKLMGTLLGLVLVYIAPVADGVVRLRLAAVGGLDGLDHHGADVPADPALLSPVALLGIGSAR